MRRVSLLTVTALLLGLHSVAWGAVPGLIPYQGRLTDAAGAPINGSQSIRFSIHSAITAGAELWFEVQPTVTVANGLFNVDLGSVTAIPLATFAGTDVFLEIKVGADAAMTPRQRLGTVAYAFRSGISPGVANATTSGGPLAINISNLSSIAVTFPTSGFAVVIGHVEFGETVPASVIHCLGVTISDVSATLQGFTSFHCVSQAGFLETNTTTHRTFSVAAGAKTFFLVANNQQDAPWNLFGTRLTVMFFPDAVGPVATTEPQPEPSSQRRIGNSDQ